MFCKECGKKIALNSKFCRFCGSKVEPEEEKEEVSTEEVEEKEDNKNIELTDNIDVTKIVLNQEEIKEEPEKKEVVENKTQDFEEVLNDINSSIDKMNDEIPSPGETKSAKDKNLDSSKEIKNILEEFENDKEEDKNSNDITDDTKPHKEDLEKTSVIVDGNVITAAESLKMKLPTDLEPQISLNEVEVNNEVPKKEKKHIVLPIILTLLLLAAIGCCGYIYMIYNELEDKVKTVEKEKEDLESQIKEFDKKEEVEEKTTYYLEGYEISLPFSEEIAYINNSLLINVDNYKIYTYIKKGEKYSTIKSSMWKNKTVIEDKEYKVAKYGTKVVASREYVVYEITNTTGNKFTVAYSDINGKDVVAFVISSSNNKLDGTELNVTNDIVNSLKENKTIVGSQIKIFNE